MADQKNSDPIALPEGRVINNSLFVKDQYNEQAVPSYKIEMAFPKGVLDAFFDQLLDAAVAKWGAGADDDQNLVLPILDGDKLAAKREAKGKPGDAYKGMEVIRANTIYNKNGDDAPGGIQVFGPDVSDIGPANQEAIYNGCHGILAVVISPYLNNDGQNALTLYMTAFQKTEDGERLTSPVDRSVLFKPVGRAPAAEGGEAAPEGGRRRRAG